METAGMNNDTYVFEEKKTSLCFLMVQERVIPTQWPSGGVRIVQVMSATDRSSPGEDVRPADGLARCLKQIKHLPKFSRK